MLYWDERGFTVSEADLKEYYDTYKDELNMSYEEYVADCLGKNGTLSKIKEV